MWQLYALGSLLFLTGEEIIDKIVIVGDLAIDILVATFYRNLVYCLIALLVGLSGLIGHVTFYISWPVILVGLMFMGSALFYTYLLKHVELTGSSALGYSRPIIFLLIDVLVLKVAFTGPQLVGVLLLILGGLLFVINPRTHWFKPEYTKFVWLIFVYETISYAVEFYVFKHYTNLNEISYIVSTNAVMITALTLVTFWKGSWKNLKDLTGRHHFLAKMFLSKSFDFTYVALSYHAMKLATVSQVSATEAFYPLILLVSLYVIQKDFKFKTGEKFDRRNLVQKALGTLVLILGIWLSA